MSTTVFLNKNKENYKMLKDTMMIFEVNMLCFCLASNNNCWRWDIGIAFLVTAFNNVKFFVIRSVRPLSYNLGSPYLVQTLIMVCTCQPGMCHLTLSSFWGSIDFNLCQVFMIKSVSLLPYNLGSSYLIHTLIMVCTCQPGMCHLTLSSFWGSIDCLIYVKFSWLNQFLYYHTT